MPTNSITANTHQKLGANPRRKYDIPIMLREIKSISPALFANLSPKYPATIVVAPLVPLPTLVITPYCVFDKPKSPFINVKRIGKAELNTCLTACPNVTVTANWFLPFRNSGLTSTDSIYLSKNSVVKTGES